MLGLSFSFKLDWGSYIISIAKIVSNKIRTLIHSIKFLSPEAALYLYKSTIRPCMRYCFHFWAGAPSCYLEMLDKLQKRRYSTLGPSLAASLESLAHHRNVSKCRNASSEVAQLLPLPCMIFLLPFIDIIRMSVSTVSFLSRLDSGIFCL